MQMIRWIFEVAGYRNFIIYYVPTFPNEGHKKGHRNIFCMLLYQSFCYSRIYNYQMISALNHVICHLPCSGYIHASAVKRERGIVDKVGIKHGCRKPL